MIEGSHPPAYVADQFDLSLASVYETLSYYYDNPDEMRAADRANAAAFERVRKSSVKPKEPIS